MDIPYLAGKGLPADGTRAGVKSRETAADTTAPAINESQKTLDEFVTITPIGRSISAAHGRVSDLPFAHDKVARIKAAIEDGSYVIDNRRLAASILGFERSLTKS